MTDRATLQKALQTTSWIQPIYTNELFFLLGVPFLMLPISPLFDDRKESRPVEKRVAMARTALTDADSRRQHLLLNHDDHIYLNLYCTQAIIFVLRVGLNAAALGMILKPIPDLKSDENRAFERVADTLTSGEESHIGWWLLLASLILHFLGYASHRLYLLRSFYKDPNAVDGPAVLQTKIYTVAHLSLLNFIIDIPGFHTLSTRLIHYVVILLNLTAGLIMAFYLAVEENFILAWGCYPRGTALKDFKYGVCPGYWRDPDHYYAPVCDSPGARCGEEEIRDGQMFTRELGIASGIVAFSLALYIISIPQKTTYYEFVRADAATYISNSVNGPKQHPN